MDSENSNSSPQTERDRINEQLDELRQNQQERKPQKKTRPHWKRRLLGFLGVISGLFLLGTSCNKPTVTCYRRAEDPDEEETSVEENDDDFDDDEYGKTLCYIYIGDEPDAKPEENLSIEENLPSEEGVPKFELDSNLYDPELEAEYDKVLGIDNEPKTQPAVSDSDAGLKEVQQYYEKVKRESFLNNVDNAENNDQPTE